MAQTAEPKFKDKGKQFPIVYEDGIVQIYKNPAGEIFVEALGPVDINPAPKLRLSFRRPQELHFTVEGLMEPEVVNGIVGWGVRRR